MVLVAPILGCAWCMSIAASGCGELVVRDDPRGALDAGDTGDDATEGTDLPPGVDTHWDAVVGTNLDAGDEDGALDNVAHDGDVLADGGTDAAAADVPTSDATRRVTVDRLGEGSGVVRSTPTGLDCGSTCSAAFQEGSVVKLIAEPAPDSELIAWSRSECGLEHECEVEVADDVSISVRFERKRYRLRVRLGGDGTGRVLSTTGEINCGADCEATLPSGTSIVLTAEPDPAVRFGGWSGACTGLSPACTLNLDRDLDVGAAFDRDRVSLSVSWTGDGDGVVQSDDALIACPPNCSASYRAGDRVTLTAAPNPATTIFNGWSGACSGQADCDLVLTESTSVLAQFQRTRLELAFDGPGQGAVTVSPGNTRCSQSCVIPFNTGTEVTLVAEPTGADRFVAFSGACAGSNTTCRLNLSGPRSVTARFRHPNPPVTNGQAPDLVLGQPGFNVALVNNPLLPGLAQMWSPRHCYIDDNDRLFVSDAMNARVLVWNAEPTTSGQPADLLLGRPEETPPVPATQPVWQNGETELGPFVGALAVYGSNLYVTDQWNSRIAAWSAVPQQLTIPPPSISFVIGQDSFSSAHRAASEREFNRPRSLSFAAGRMFVTDSQNNRVMIYDQVPTTGGSHSATGLLGQSAWDTQTIEPVTASSMYYPMDAFYDALGDRLYVADGRNHRVLTWNGIPTQIGAPANLVLGQTSGSQHEPNRGGDVGPLTMRDPTSALVYGGSLFIADGSNKRVLIWTPPPDRADIPPSRVLGQPDFNEPEPEALPRSFTPWGICAANDHLYIADHVHNRILRYVLSP